MTELNQMLVPLIQAPADRPTGNVTDPPTLDWLRNATIADHPSLVPRKGPPRTAASYPVSRTDDLKEDVLACQARVEKLGLEFLVPDQTRPETGMPVVKVIVSSQTSPVKRSIRDAEVNSNAKVRFSR